MTTPELLLVTYPHFVELSLQLATKIEREHKQKPFDLLISINRGGAVLSRILSDFLDVNIAAFSIASYNGLEQQKSLQISQALNLTLKDKKILLVDEICDTGKTFIAAIEHVQHLDPEEIKTCSIFEKTHSLFHPNYISAVTDNWVVFPYEVRETIKSLEKFMEYNPPLREQLLRYFQSNGVSLELLSMLLPER